MTIHRRLIILVGLGMLLIMTIAVFSLRDNIATLSLSTKGVGEVFAELQRIGSVENNVADMSLSVYRFMESGNKQHRTSYEGARDRLREVLRDLNKMEHPRQEMAILSSLSAHFNEMDMLSERLFYLRTRVGNSHVLSGRDIIALDGAIKSLEHDIEQYQDENSIRMGSIAKQLRDNKARINVLFITNLIVSIMFLLAFGVYLHRKVSSPLAAMWKGTEEISRGHLDYRIQVQGAQDIDMLAERFNEMTLKLKQAYLELEQRLSDRTQELAALDAVALTLSVSRNLKDMLSKSLDHLIDNLPSLDPRGGVFLCDPDGEYLHLMVQKGLSSDFTLQEETIRMGECLCGFVAQTGEILYSEKCSEDPRHTRSGSAQAHAHIIIPIKSRGIVLGVIFLYPQKDFTLKPSDLQMLETIGSQIGLGVENIRFYAEVKESSEKFWDLFENSRDILFTMDRSGGLTAVNNASELFFGYSKVELVGKNIFSFLITPEDIETTHRILAGTETTTHRIFEFEAVKRGGNHAFFEVTLRKLIKNRVLTGFQASARDVTEQKNLREMVLKTERLCAIGELGVAVRHEINNPLSTIIGNVELLIERYGEKDQDLLVRLEMILSNSLRIAEIVRRMQELKQDKVVDYLKGIKMTDLK